MEDLIYTPLPPINPTGKTPPYSRLIELWPGEGPDPFYCTLEIVDLENFPLKFEALSYVWGREKTDNPLLCGDIQGRIHGQLEITRNLEDALRALRLPNLRRRLWIDAVCINQKDFAERARQVSYMRSVYQHATRVVIWLGSKDLSVRRAFAFAHELALLVSELSMNSQSPQSPEQAQRSQLITNSILIDTMKSRPEDAMALDTLLSKEYFERVWCIQEVAAAKACIAKCEDLEIDFDFLLVLVGLVIQYRGLQFNTSGLRMWQMMANLKLLDRNEYAPEGSLGPMLLVLMIIRNFKSTNPVDRIFALLGCTNEGLEPVLGSFTTFNGPKSSLTLALAQKGLSWLHKKVNSLGPGVDIGRNPALKPNYEKSVRDVFRDFTRYCVRRPPRLLDVLSHVQHHEDIGSDDEFPTWVPKFHETRIASFFVLEAYMAGIPPTGHYPYFAIVHDNPLREDAPRGPRIMEPNVLQADGFRVDIVEAVSETVTQDVEGNISPETIWSQLFAFPLFPRPKKQYDHGKEALDVAFFMTLLAGGVGNSADLEFASASFAGKNASRTEVLDFVTRQAKGDIYEWLRGQPNVDLGAYADLVHDSRDVVHEQGRLRFESFSFAYSFNRKVYRTRSGIIGLGPKIMKPGEFVIVLFGGKLPFILRQVRSEWYFIGETYLRDDSIMLGHAVTEARSSRGKQRVETFRMR
ncbi:HET-domain-containing protein [Lojkania enalia]|uniref:HET-domain-containing protein n=1 Tax=Lojkania enalia TaxID=147567 RepID=A0A9P4TPN9_9PLEO|nr:HET-domain-containing protein [Didymosphaeria enalia]